MKPKGQFVCGKVSLFINGKYLYNVRALLTGLLGYFCALWGRSLRISTPGPKNRHIWDGGLAGGSTEATVTLCMSQSWEWLVWFLGKMSHMVKAQNNVWDTRIPSKASKATQWIPASEWNFQVRNIGFLRPSYTFHVASWPSGTLPCGIRGLIVGVEGGMLTCSLLPLPTFCGPAFRNMTPKIRGLVTAPYPVPRALFPQ